MLIALIASALATFSVTYFFLLLLFSSCSNKNSITFCTLTGTSNLFFAKAISLLCVFFDTETDLNFSTLGIFFSLFNYDPPDRSDPPQNSLRE